MKQSLRTSITQLMAPVFIFILLFFAPKTFAAFVPASEPAKQQIEANPANMRDASLQLALMSNKDIEALTGKKLTLKEKVGLYFFRRKVEIRNSSYFANNTYSNENCFTMYLKNGEVIEVKLIQITTNEIKYQRCNKPDDPEIVIAKKDVFSVKDDKGEAIYSSKDENWNKGYYVSDGRTDRLALASGITGIAALTVGLFFWPVGLAAALAAGIMGIKFMGRYRENRKLRGLGWSITGVVAGGIWVLMALLVLIIYASLTW